MLRLLRLLILALKVVALCYHFQLLFRILYPLNDLSITVVQFPQDFSLHNVIFHAAFSSTVIFPTLLHISFIPLLLMHLEPRIAPHLLTLLVPYLSSHGKFHINSE